MCKISIARLSLFALALLIGASEAWGESVLTGFSWEAGEQGTIRVDGAAQVADGTAVRLVLRERTAATEGRFLGGARAEVRDGVFRAVVAPTRLVPAVIVCQMTFSAPEGELAESVALRIGGDPATDARLYRDTEREILRLLDALDSKRKAIEGDAVPLQAGPIERHARSYQTLSDEVANLCRVSDVARAAFSRTLSVMQAGINTLGGYIQTGGVPPAADDLERGAFGLDSLTGAIEEARATFVSEVKALHLGQVAGFQEELDAAKRFGTANDAWHHEWAGRLCATRAIAGEDMGPAGSAALAQGVRAEVMAAFDLLLACPVAAGNPSQMAARVR